VRWRSDGGRLKPMGDRLLLAMTGLILAVTAPARR
jgi:hypothetical protein